MNPLTHVLGHPNDPPRVGLKRRRDQGLEGLSQVVDVVPFFGDLSRTHSRGTDRTRPTYGGRPRRPSRKSEYVLTCPPGSPRLGVPGPVLSKRGRLGLPPLPGPRHTLRVRKLVKECESNCQRDEKSGVRVTQSHKSSEKCTQKTVKTV